MNNLRIRREELGVSRFALANKTGLSIDTIGRYERGEREPRFSEIQKFAEVLNCPVEYFFDENPPTPLTSEETEQGEGAVKPAA